jgi:hypothetical protein
MTLEERIEEQSFCYDPDFPPEVPEGLPLTAAKPEPQPDPVKRALRACAAAVSRRSRSS